MQFRRLAARAACAAVLSCFALSVSAELPAAKREVAHPEFGGWRAVRRVETADGSDTPGTPSIPKVIPRDLATSDDSTDDPLSILAQSPDDDFDHIAPASPNWSYPSRRATTTVPVPNYHGQVDMSRLRGGYDSLALNAVGRTSAASPPRTNPAAASYQYPYQPSQAQSPAYESPPSLP